jgi:hypothetical protein
MIFVSLLVAPCLSISPSDCTRARSAIRVVVAVPCESDDSIFEAGGRSKARHAETSDDECLRDALLILSPCGGQDSWTCSRRSVVGLRIVPFALAQPKPNIASDIECALQCGGLTEEASLHTRFGCEDATNKAT